MIRQVAPAKQTSSNSYNSSRNSGGNGSGTVTPAQPALAPVAFTSQPISRPVELPPQYRPRKQRKQVNVACLPCRKRRSKCSGTAPCSRCEADGSECVFDGRKDAQERNRELRTSEKALSKVFRVLRRLDAGDSTSSTASLSHIRRIARETPDFQKFAREIFELDEKAIDASNEFDHLSPKQKHAPQSAGQTSATPPSSTEEQSSPSATHRSDPVDSRKNSVSSHIIQRHHLKNSISGFGNLPFSSAIKANGYPAAIQQQQLQNLSWAEHSLLPLHTLESEVLGRTYLSFRDAALQMIYDGVPVADVLGSPDYVNLDLYFRDRTPEDGHNVSTFVCEVMKQLANPDVAAKLASMVLLAPMMRWILFPTAENYARIPTLMRPLPSQRFIPHSPALDLAPHPAIREALMQNFNNEWLTPENQCDAAPVVNWPYGLEETVYYDPVVGCLRFTKAFEDHVCNPESWTFFKRSLKVYPDLRAYGARFTDLDDDYEVD